jgi:hypothetical protein
MRALICGSRDWTNRGVVAAILHLLPSGTTIIHGAAAGADTIADEAALECGFKVEPYPADWRKYGRAAGPLRNQQMLEAQPDVVLAFHDSIWSSKGTVDMLRRAQAANVPIHLFTSDLRRVDHISFAGTPKSPHKSIDNV